MDSSGAKNSYTPSATTSTPSTSPTMSPSLRPRHFISRRDGTLTALIAVDELPPTVRIAGVPRILQPYQIEGMKSCGVEPHRHQHYIIEATKNESLNGSSNPNSNVNSNHQAGDSNENAAPSEGYQAPNPEFSTASGHSGPQSGQHLQGVDSWRKDVKGVDNTQATIDAITAANTTKAIERTPYGSATPNAVTPGTFGKKVYCTHWIRRGECDYTQQGCLYKHEMPDEASLDAIGIKGYPRWYIEAHPELFPVTGWSGRTIASTNPWKAQTARLAITAPTSPFVGHVQSSGDIRSLNYRQLTPVFPGSHAPSSRFTNQMHGIPHRFAQPQAVSALVPKTNTMVITSQGISPQPPDFAHSVLTQGQGQQLQTSSTVARLNPPNMRRTSEVTAGSSSTPSASVRQLSPAAPQFHPNANTAVTAAVPEAAEPAVKTALPQRSGTATPEAATSVCLSKDEASVTPGQPTVVERPSTVPFALPQCFPISAGAGKFNALGRFVPPDYQSIQTSTDSSATLSGSSGKASERPASFARFSNLQSKTLAVSQPASTQQSSFVTNTSAPKLSESTVNLQGTPAVSTTFEVSNQNTAASSAHINNPKEPLPVLQAPLPHFLPSYSVLVPSPASASKPRTSSPLQQNQLAKAPVGIPVTAPPYHRRLFVAAGEEKPVFTSRKAEKSIVKKAVNTGKEEAAAAEDEKTVGPGGKRVIDVNEENMNGGGNKKIPKSNSKKHNGGREKKTSPNASNGNRAKESKNGNGGNSGNGENSNESSSSEGKGDKLIEI